MQFNKQPSEPKLEDFSLTESDRSDYKKFVRQTKNGAGCSFVAYLTGAGMAFMGILMIGAIPTSCSGADGSVLVTIAGVIAFFVFINFYKSESDQKISLSEEELEAHKKYELALKDYESELYEFNQKQKEHWFSMSGHNFEHEFGKLLDQEGYSVLPTRGSGDGGIDLVATKDSQEIIIQCKAWKNPVGPAPIRELQGVKEDNQQAWVVGLGGFTSGAKEFANKKGIRLIEYADIEKMVQRKFATS